MRRVQCRTVPSKNLLEGHGVDSVVSPSSGDGHSDAGTPVDDELATGDEGVDDSWVTTDQGVEVHGTWAATSPSYAATHGLGGRAFSNWEDKSQSPKNGDTNNKHGQTKRRWGVRRGAAIARMRWAGGPGGHKAKPRVVQALTMMGWPIEISHPHASEMVTSILEHTWNRGFLLEMRDAIHAMVQLVPALLPCPFDSAHVILRASTASPYHAPIMPSAHAVSRYLAHDIAIQPYKHACVCYQNFSSPPPAFPYLPPSRRRTDILPTWQMHATQSCPSY